MQNTPSLLRAPFLCQAAEQIEQHAPDHHQFLCDTPAAACRYRSAEVESAFVSSFCSRVQASVESDSVLVDCVCVYVCVCVCTLLIEEIVECKLLYAVVWFGCCEGSKHKKQIQKTLRVKAYQACYRPRLSSRVLASS
jgi:hypothetical protein